MQRERSLAIVAPVFPVLVILVLVVPALVVVAPTLVAVSLAAWRFPVHGLLARCLLFAHARRLLWLAVDPISLAAGCPLIAWRRRGTTRIGLLRRDLRRLLLQRLWRLDL